MVNAILSLIANSFISGLAVIGAGTLINKLGKFFKIIEESSEDGYRKGFDAIMVESIDEINNCVESSTRITNNFHKIFFIIYDISIGNKFIKKNKEGKLIICTKSKIYSGYKDKIEELNDRVKKYQDELNKMKHKKNIDISINKKDKENKEDNDDNDEEENDSDNSSELSDTDTSTDNREKSDKSDKNNDYYLEKD
jgi:hypothetical protein